MAIICPMH